MTAVDQAAVRITTQLAEVFELDRADAELIRAATVAGLREALSLDAAAPIIEAELRRALDDADVAYSRIAINTVEAMQFHLLR